MPGKMDEYKAEMEAMIERMHEFYVIVKRAHGDRSAAFERYRSLQQCVGILNYNICLLYTSDAADE